MNQYALSAGYDAWRTRAPEDAAPFHPGPHERPLCLEGDGWCIDATGHYDGDGALLSVQIGRLNIKPENVARALELLRVECPGWDAPLDGDTLAELARDALEYEAELAADARADRW